MQATQHQVTQYYQPTANTCGYAALAILLSHYGSTMTAEEVVLAVPQPEDENGKPTGSITAQLATWLRTQGYGLTFYSFDCQILDLSWQHLDGQDVIYKLKQVKYIRNIGGLGKKYWSALYAQAYIDYLEHGGVLKIQPHVTSKLLYGLLRDGPVYANFCSTLVNGKGRASHPKPQERVSVPDDIQGTVGTHSVVIYGNNQAGDFLVADPWEGQRTIDCETMLCGITAAQIECDNQCFQITDEA
jgi:hypothetical protein